MADELVVMLNEETGMWEQKPEPFAVVEYQTEEDFEHLKSVLDFYKKHRWVSVKDRLPPVGEEVLCLCDCGYEGIRHYGIGWVLSSDFWYAVTPIGQKPKVLAWMPLPESPEPPMGVSCKQVVNK